MRRSHKAPFPGPNLCNVGNVLQGVLEKSDHKVQTAVESRALPDVIQGPVKLRL